MKKAAYTLSGETYKEWYYIYDENGNLTAKGNEVTGSTGSNLSLVKDTASSRYWEYEYTADNRLKAAYYKGELKAEYSYDVDGKRIVSNTGEGTISFFFSFSGKVLLEESAGSDGKNKLTSFIYALSKQIARVEGVIGGEGEVIYYHHDNLGSTRLMTNSSGEVVFDQEYLPFGGDLALVGDIEPTNDIEESYKYTGHRQEVAVGLYYYGARFYDPELGRFISEDTYVGVLTNPQSQNIFIYTLNNPMKYVDPSGHVAIGPVLPSIREAIDPDYEYKLEDNPVGMFLQGGIDSVVNNAVGVYSMVAHPKETVSGLYQLGSNMIDRANNSVMPGSIGQRLTYEITAAMYDSAANL